MKSRESLSELQVEETEYPLLSERIQSTFIYTFFLTLRPGNLTKSCIGKFLSKRLNSGLLPSLKGNYSSDVGYKIF